MLKRLLAVAVACATLGIGFMASSAVSANSSTSSAGQTRMHVGFKVGKFVKRGHRLVALGTVTATANLPDGTKHSTSKTFHARVLHRGIRTLSATATCAVLSLQLDKLSLTLLGLNVNLDKVVLTITANSDEGVLGSLFCSLAHSKVKLTAAYAHHLTRVMHKSGLSSSNHLLGVSTPMSQRTLTATQAVCPILDLVLGPLHLDLLGLIVDLNQVHLTITADPNGGVLGSLFCSLASTTTTTTTTTTAPAST